MATITVFERVNEEFVKQEINLDDVPDLEGESLTAEEYCDWVNGINFKSWMEDGFFTTYPSMHRS